MWRIKQKEIKYCFDFRRYFKDPYTDDFVSLLWLLRAASHTLLKNETSDLSSVPGGEFWMKKTSSFQKSSNPNCHLKSKRSLSCDTLGCTNVNFIFLRQAKPYCEHWSIFKTFHFFQDYLIFSQNQKTCNFLDFFLQSSHEICLWVEARTIDRE